MQTVSIKLNDQLNQRVTELARQAGVSRSEIIRAALTAYLPAAGQSALDLAGPAVGAVEGPGDLSTNPEYLRDFGQ